MTARGKVAALKKAEQMSVYTVQQEGSVDGCLPLSPLRKRSRLVGGGVASWWFERNEESVKFPCGKFQLTGEAASWPWATLRTRRGC